MTNMTFEEALLLLDKKIPILFTKGGVNTTVKAPKDLWVYKLDKDTTAIAISSLDPFRAHLGWEPDLSAEDTFYGRGY